MSLSVRHRLLPVLLTLCLGLLTLSLLWSDESVAAKRSLGAVVAPVRLVPTTSDPIAIDGLHSYLGSVELRAAGDGIVVVNRLSVERYLLGLAEVPLDWPMESLKAQAVAARTYALNTLARPRAGEAAVYGFDICASVQCQVFAGADVVMTEDGPRWREAVGVTEGETLLYAGAPILARYHSTSGGRTLDNPQAFPDEPAYPYLQGVVSDAEQGSPLYRWRTSFTLRDLQAILVRAGWWGDEFGRLKSVRSIASRQRLHYPDLLFRGTKASLRRTAEEFRDIARDLAPAMFPGDYPSAGPTSSGVLPETMPSNRVAVTTRSSRVIIIGRGWGHGVGMSQWGAHGLASQGATYSDILGHYYTGVSLATLETQRPISVGVSWGEGEVRASGAFSIVDGRGRTIVRRALGDWIFDWAGSGVVAIDPPRGYGLPLEVGIVKAPKRVPLGGNAWLTVALSRPARVRAVTRSDEQTRLPEMQVKSAGKRRIPWFAPIEAGRYEVVVTATTGGTERESRPVVIEVVEPPPEEPLRDDVVVGSEQGSDPPYVLIGAGVVALLLAVGVAVAVGRIHT